MGIVSDDETRVILRKLATCVLWFYILYYLVSLLYVLAFGLPFTLYVCFPFYFDDDDFKPLLRSSDEDDRELPLASWLSCVTTMLLSTILIFFIVKNTRKAWDYATSISMIHFVVCCLVNQAFPLNWIWWVTIIPTTFMLSSLSELSIYYLHDMKEIDLEK
mmetsp:Transcript_17242/g.23821  ORF Transcript_17242/g.23821 Transcript_17242/m.23821 type:complete len:161 (-) Transcript_17242:423-905(-)